MWACEDLWLQVLAVADNCTTTQQINSIQSSFNKSTDNECYQGYVRIFYGYMNSIKVHFSGIYLVMVIFTGSSKSFIRAKGSLQNNLFSQPLFSSKFKIVEEICWHWQANNRQIREYMSAYQLRVNQGHQVNPSRMVRKSYDLLEPTSFQRITLFPLIST